MTRLKSIFVSVVFAVPMLLCGCEGNILGDAALTAAVTLSATLAEALGTAIANNFIVQ